MVLCTYCNKKFGCKKIHEHYIECIPMHNNSKTGYLVMFSGYSISQKYYFMYTFIEETTKLSNIDKFLRNKWCECCNHKSEFKYMLSNIPKKTLINNFDIGDLIVYTYDFGSTTTIFIKILKKIKSKNTNNTKNNIKPYVDIDPVLYNDEHIINCTTENCINKAIYYINYQPLCFNCTEENEDNESKLLIVNSPRTGECGYE